MPTLLALLLQAAPAPQSPGWLLHYAPLVSIVIGCLMPFVLLVVNRATAARDKNQAAAAETVRQHADAERHAITERLDAAEAEIRHFVGSDTLDKRFSEAAEHRRLLGTEHGNLLNILREQQREQDKILAWQARTDDKLATLNALPPRVTELESSFRVIAEQMRSMKEAQSEIKASLGAIQTNMDTDYKNLLAAIQATKPQP